MGEQLYSLDQPANRAFLLRSGTIEYRVTEEDSITLSGNNIIVGASEILIAMNRKEAVKRHMSLFTKPDAVISPFPAEKLASVITTYSIGFSVAHHIAQTITKLHNVLSKKMNKLHETERLSRDMSRTFVEIVQFLEQESHEQHFPWLFSLIEKGKSSNAYNFGLSFSVKSDDKKIDVSAENLIQYKQNYPRGSVICKEGEQADEMFILMSGKIEVRIKNNPIDIIARKGTIIGEMGLILGMPRTATLRALEDVSVVKISSKDMESIFKNDPETFLDMISSLAFRENDNCEKIREYEEMVKLVSKGKGEYSMTQVADYASELSRFMSEIDGISQENMNMEWLSHIKELAERKVTDLLRQVNLMTGDDYLPSANGGPAPLPQKEKKENRPIRDTTVPDIDWS